jgi:histidine triad (HIT) family protein
MDHCTFCQIARHERHATVVHEDAIAVAFLDICPIRPGHVQIIPRVHYPYFDDLPGDTSSHIIHLGQRLARAMKEVYDVSRVAFLFTGGDVAHAHAHVVPMHEKTDITSRQYIVERDLTFQSPSRASAEGLADAAVQLRAVIGRLDA